MRIFAPAKINLTLDIFEKKTEAPFHEIQTIYHKLSWGDTLEFSESDAFSISGDFDCEMEENLIYKSFLLIKKIIHKARPVHISVAKNIPTGSGLGGGSSNAAMFIKGYFQYFNLGPIPTDLITEIGTLGKDIPFFLQEAPCALGTHFGESIEPLNFNFSGQAIYLYFPPFKSNTKNAYSQLKNFNTSYTKTFLEHPKLENCGNGFKEIFDQKNYSKINLSGSGSTFFSFEKFDIPECQVVEAELL